MKTYLYDQAKDTVLNYHSSPFYYKIAVHFTLLPELNAQFFHRFHIGILDKYEIFTRNLYILMTLVVSGGQEPEWVTG